MAWAIVAAALRVPAGKAVLRVVALQVEPLARVLLLVLVLRAQPLVQAARRVVVLLVEPQRAVVQAPASPVWTWPAWLKKLALA